MLCYELNSTTHDCRMLRPVRWQSIVGDAETREWKTRDEISQGVESGTIVYGTRNG